MESDGALLFYQLFQYNMVLGLEIGELLEMLYHLVLKWNFSTGRYHNLVLKGFWGAPNLVPVLILVLALVAGQNMTSTKASYKRSCFSSGNLTK
jgi:hypothetical protein